MSVPVRPSSTVRSISTTCSRFSVKKFTQAYLVNAIQEVYRLQGVNINDKHIETISRQMMRWSRSKTSATPPSSSRNRWNKFRFREENDRVIAQDGRPATGRPLLLGITKASLSTDSFISAASFQETTRVLTEAAVAGKVDYLRGLKENVIMGRLIPAGTGLEHYRSIQLLTEMPAPVPVEDLPEACRICRCGRSRWPRLPGRHKEPTPPPEGPGLIGLGEFSPRISQLTNGASVSPAAPFFCLAMIATFSAFPFTS